MRKGGLPKTGVLSQIILHVNAQDVDIGCDSFDTFLSSIVLDTTFVWLSCLMGWLSQHFCGLQEKPGFGASVEYCSIGEGIGTIGELYHLPGNEFTSSLEEEFHSSWLFGGEVRGSFFYL